MEIAHTHTHRRAHTQEGCTSGGAHISFKAGCKDFEVLQVFKKASGGGHVSPGAPRIQTLTVTTQSESGVRSTCLSSECRLGFLTFFTTVFRWFWSAQSECPNQRSGVGGLLSLGSDKVTLSAFQRVLVPDQNQNQDRISSRPSPGWANSQRCASLYHFTLSSAIR